MLGELVARNKSEVASYTSELVHIETKLICIQLELHCIAELFVRITIFDEFRNQLYL